MSACASRPSSSDFLKVLPLTLSAVSTVVSFCDLCEMPVYARHVPSSAALARANEKMKTVRCCPGWRHHAAAAPWSVAVTR